MSPVRPRCNVAPRVLCWGAAACALTTALACTAPPALPKGPTRRAENGVLDLHGWSAERDGPVELAGEWRFFWHDLLDPSIGCDGARARSELVELPGRWTGKAHDGDTLGAVGYATYCLEVLLDPREAPLSLLFPRVKTAGALWVDGRQVAADGSVGTDRTTSRPVRIDHLLSVTPSERMELLVQVSNFHFRSGGPDRPLRLGSPSDLEPIPDTALAVRSSLFVGAFVILGLYHLVLFGLARRSPAPLHFALICLIMGVYQITRDNNLFVTLFPFVHWAGQIRLEYTLFAASVPLSAAFITAVYPREFPPALTRTSLVAAGAFALSVWVTPTLLSSRWTLPLFQAFFLAAGAYGIWRMALAVMRRRPGARWFLVGGGLWVVAGACDGLTPRYAPKFPDLLPYGFLAMILGQSFLLATAQATSTERARELSNRLMVLASEKLALEQQAFRDPLTGLENRRRLDQGLVELQARARARERGEPDAADGQVSLLYLDLDDFKAVNDRYGHEAGDEILVQVAGRLREEVRAYDLSVRLGGDEFVVLMPEVGAVGAQAQAERLRESLGRPMRIGDRELQLSVSIGTASLPAHRADLGELLRLADAAMYRRKRGIDSST